MDYLADYARRGFDIEVTCLDCGRVVVFPTREMIDYFHSRQWLTSIETVKLHLVCKGERAGIRGCGSRRVRVRATAAPPTPPDPPPPAAPRIRREDVPLGIGYDEWAKADYYGRRRLLRRARG